MNYVGIFERWTSLLVGPEAGIHSTEKSIQLLDMRIESIMESAIVETPLSFDGTSMWEFSKKLRLLAIGTKSKNSTFHDSTTVVDYVTSGLVALQNAGYNQNMTAVGNWWEWTIGIPQSIVDILVLLRGRIPAVIVTSLQNTIEHNIPDPSLNKWARTAGNRLMTTANLLDQIQPLLLLACLSDNPEEIHKLTIQITSSANFVDKGEGLYADGSYLFHVNKPYNGTYGAVFFNVLLKFIYVLDSTDFSLGCSVTIFMNKFADRALVPLIIGKEYAGIVCGRAAHRNSRASDSLQNIVDLLIYNQITKSEITELDKFCEKILSQPSDDFLENYSPEQWNSPSAISGWFAYLNKLRNSDKTYDPASELIGRSYMTWYPTMQRGVYRSSEGWIIEFALADRNVAYYESSATENSHGYHSGNGAYWLHPVNRLANSAFKGVEPHSVPGSTIDTDVVYVSSKPWSNLAPDNEWAGAIGDGLEFAILSLDMRGYGDQLCAFKSWFVHTNFIVYMASNIVGQSKNARSILFSTANAEEYIFKKIDSRTMKISGWGTIYSLDAPLDIEFQSLDTTEHCNSKATVFLESKPLNREFTVIIVPEKTSSSLEENRGDLPNVGNLVRSGSALHTVWDECGSHWGVSQGPGSFQLGKFQITVSRGCIVSIQSAESRLDVLVMDPADLGADLSMKLKYESNAVMHKKDLLFPSLDRNTMKRTIK